MDQMFQVFFIEFAIKVKRIKKNFFHSFVRYRSKILQIFLL